ncbi:MAG TPA: hypothetical protein VIF43_01620 [Patescibacteria group bacterium]|jgi:hypothetical protein
MAEEAVELGERVEVEGPEGLPPITVVDEGECLKIRMEIGEDVRLRFNRFGDGPAYLEALEIRGREVMVESLIHDGYPPLSELDLPEGFEAAVPAAADSYLCKR